MRRAHPGEGGQLTEQGTALAVQELSGVVLFADLTRPQLEAIARIFTQEVFPEGQRVLRQGFSGSNLYVILEGQAAVNVSGRTAATLGKGDCFGEISILLGDSPTADVVATTPLRCLVLPADEVKGFLLGYPSVMYRMLQAEALRLRNAMQWQT